MKKLSALLCSAAVFVPAAATAQSTGTVEQEQHAIVVTGKSRPGVDGIVAPPGVKTRGVLTQEFIAKQRPGQSIDETINMLPGVAFQNNDPYGSSGGTLTIRGFDASRISQTFDGLPLNDTGNYALYSNQQLDPELIQQVNVNLGTTDVDSPTAAATGSTVNYRSVDPTLTPGVRMVGSIGDWDFRRIFGMVNTGTFTPWGTRAWVAGSFETNQNPYQRTSKTHKEQYNAKIYQPIGSNGDFISIAGHYNANRNGNFASVPLRIDTTQSSTNSAPRVVGSGSTNRFPITRHEREYTLAPCTTDTPQAGVADVPNSCGTAFDYSFNPSNTGNIRINSKFSLASNLILTVDPSFQYTRANGGSGAVKGNEGFKTVGGTPIFGYIGGQPYFGGIDLNGDGDLLDQVEVYAPSETETHRYGLISNLRWDFAPGQSFRVSYSHDYGRHRQTGEVALLQDNGHTTEYFPINDSVKDATGLPIEKRNRKSFAILDKVAADYTGHFIDDKLTVNLGLAAPYFKRDLNNYCVTESNGTFVDCFNDAASQAAFLTANPAYTPPTHRVLKYHKLLPTGGFNYQLNTRLAVYGDYNKGLQVPGTDNLYQSLAFPVSQSPHPETTDNFDAGVRYSSARVQAQLAAWYTIFNNRLASSYDPVQDITIYRNLGTVHKYGLDGQIAYQPIKAVTLYAFGSILKSKILENVQTGSCTAAQVTAGASTGTGTCTVLDQPIFVNGLTAGKRESGAPTYLLGGRAEWNTGPVVLGVQAKRTGPRYVNDQNVPIFSSGYTVYPAKTPAYTVVDLDARINLGSLLPHISPQLGRQTYLQLNVTNVFDKLYVAGFGGNTSSSSIPFAYIGAPRTFSASLNIGF
ncbi:MAG TPA: TonB-dependent receptor [Sphingomicrobium sp.]|nr:TonB-dependent receptor [Sphingomicrobium sp.]